MGTTTSPSDGMPESLKVQSLSSSDNNSNNDIIRGGTGTTTILKSAGVGASNGDTIESLNDLRLSDHTDVTQNSFGNSSLSSFLSVLLEDEESSEFLIVPDNPKLSEKRSIRDLRLPFSSEQGRDNKPKSRWDYLVKTGSDKDLSSPRRRNMKSSQLRSSSFSGAINSSRKPQLRTNNSFSSSNNKNSNNKNSNNNNNNVKGGSNSNKFLQMPLRQESPTEDEMSRKLLIDRLNQSESDLRNMQIPKSYCRDRNNNNSNDNATNYRNATSLVGRRRQDIESAELLRRSGPDRFGSNSPRSTNASWSKAELQAKRNEESSLFFDMMMEPDGDAAAGATSPLTNSLSSIQSSSSSAFQELINSSIK